MIYFHSILLSFTLSRRLYDVGENFGEAGLMSAED